MKVQLSKAEVTIKDALTWGDIQKIESALMSAAKMRGSASNVDSIGIDFDASAMLESKYVALECAVKKVEVDGNAVTFTREWMNNLSEQDGDKLMEAVDGLRKKDQGTTGN